MTDIHIAQLYSNRMTVIYSHARPASQPTIYMHLLMHKICNNKSKTPLDWQALHMAKLSAITTMECRDIYSNNVNVSQ